MFEAIVISYCILKPYFCDFVYTGNTDAQPQKRSSSIILFRFCSFIYFLIWLMCKVLLVFNPP